MKFTMSSMPSKSICQKPEKVTCNPEKKQSIETNPGMTELIELVTRTKS